MRELEVKVNTWVLPPHTCAIEHDMRPAYCKSCLPTGCGRCAVAVYLHTHADVVLMGDIAALKLTEHRECRLPREFCRQVRVCPIIPEGVE